MHDEMPGGVTKTSRRFEAKTASAALAHLKTLLESNDGDAVEAFFILESALAGTCDEHRLRALSTAINEFEFDNALATLDEIAKECGVNWEQAK